VDSERAETYLRLLAEGELRHSRGNAAEHAAAPADRVAAVAVALAEVGALDQELARSIVAGVEMALAVRSHRPLATNPGPPRSPRWRHAAGPAPGPRGPVQVTPASRIIRLRHYDDEVEAYLLALVRTPASAWLTVAGRNLNPSTAKNTPAMRPFDRLTAADDHGRTYTVRFAGRGNTEWHDGEFSLDPPPPPDIGWLELTQGECAVRIDLAEAQRAADVTAERVSLGPGDRFLALKAETLITSPSGQIARKAGSLAKVVPALEAAGALDAGSPMPGQVAALCERLGVHDHGIAAPPTGLPERWASVLAHPRREPRDYRDPGTAGPLTGAAELAVALPAVDGAHMALAGLVSMGDETTLHAVAAGMAPGSVAFSGSIPSCWLLDSLGQWHVAHMDGWKYGDGHAVRFIAEVTPPVPRSATWVEVLLTGRTAQVRATVPLRWWAP
jgi:hypothetical protein